MKFYQDLCLNLFEPWRAKLNPRPVVPLAMFCLHVFWNLKTELLLNLELFAASIVMTDYDRSLPCQLGGSTSWFSIIESKIERQDHTSWQSIRIPDQLGAYLSLFCGEIVKYNNQRIFPYSYSYSPKRPHAFVI